MNQHPAPVFIGGAVTGTLLMTLLLICTGVKLALPGESVAPRGAVVVSVPCQQEDGRLDGQPCLWRDPRTGAVLVVDSSEARRK